MGVLRGRRRTIQGYRTPGRYRALAYIDWSAQEVAIAAALSGDDALADAIATQDPYLAFAKRAALVPPDATRRTHKAMRDLCKTVVLGSNYGMGAQSLAYRTGLSVIEARELLRRLAVAYPVFWEWAEHVIDVGVLSGRLSTVFGWPLHVTDASRSTALRNFPMQAHGAEMLRLACSLTTERGIDVCAPVHDAVMIEADVDHVDEAVAVTRSAMGEASRSVLSGPEVDTDAEMIPHPGRYADPRGAVMWSRVTELLERLSGGRIR